MNFIENEKSRRLSHDSVSLRNKIKLYHPSPIGPDGSILEPARIVWSSNSISLMDGFTYFFISFN